MDYHFHMPFPGYMLEGAQIDGTISQAGLQATITGSTNQFDMFTIQINDTF